MLLSNHLKVRRPSKLQLMQQQRLHLNQLKQEKGNSKPSKPHEFTGSIADWAKLKSSPAEYKQEKSPPKESAAMSSEQSTPQASPSENYFNQRR